MTHPPSIDDESLIAALRLSGGRDPVPAHVAAAAQAVFGLRLPEAVTARSTVTTAPAGIRSSDETRLLRFAAAELTVDLEVTSMDGLVDLAGQVSPPPEAGARVEVRTLHLTEARELSPTGQFAVTGLPPGWFSVVCHRPEHSSVATSWTRIRL
ncbi:hypothetical protein OHA77_32390 [Streptosporangium sp. NBC_01639]|uniref:hypothetical protein n=1 Tax=unclassified Streptosporangium TaxID=2632669 RepID=UPI002DD8E576|nr:hypothetical protein [Streptosporangium sp. NBC_01756]WSC88025.1 hypothetical protein OIE48_07395 [Streptosporangium sp. NBC_01756]WTD53297.1 hypothetical protein OHA77_32390 [Streptosporangium sp. NBC_01639]